MTAPPSAHRRRAVEDAGGKAAEGVRAWGGGSGMRSWACVLRSLCDLVALPVLLQQVSFTLGAQGAAAAERLAGHLAELIAAAKV